MRAKPLYRTAVALASLLGMLLWPLSAAATASQPLATRYAELLAYSRLSQPQPVTADATDTAITLLRKRNGDGSHGNANASLLATGRCHLLYATTAHALMDNSYRYRAPPQDVAIRLGEGRWQAAIQLVTGEPIHTADNESSDWGLVVLSLPACDGAQYTPLPNAEVNQAQLERCSGRASMQCYHFRDSGPMLMRETGCALQSESRSRPEPHRIGYVSCDQSEGVSGCAVQCSEQDAATTLGIFSYGLRPEGSEAHIQQVGVFRVLDGDFYRALGALKQRYDLR